MVKEAQPSLVVHPKLCVSGLVLAALFAVCIRGMNQIKQARR